MDHRVVSRAIATHCRYLLAFSILLPPPSKSRKGDRPTFASITSSLPSACVEGTLLPLKKFLHHVRRWAKVLQFLGGSSEREGRSRNAWAVDKLAIYVQNNPCRRSWEKCLTLLNIIIFLDMDMVQIKYNSKLKICFKLTWVSSPTLLQNSESWFLN